MDSRGQTRKNNSTKKGYFSAKQGQMFGDQNCTDQTEIARNISLSLPSPLSPRDCLEEESNLRFMTTNA